MSREGDQTEYNPLRDVPSLYGGKFIQEEFGSTEVQRRMQTAIDSLHTDVINRLEDEVSISSGPSRNAITGEEAAKIDQGGRPVLRSRVLAHVTAWERFARGVTGRTYGLASTGRSYQLIDTAVKGAAALLEQEDTLQGEQDARAMVEALRRHYPGIVDQPQQPSSQSLLQRIRRFLIR